MTYEEFLQHKQIKFQSTGIENPGELNPMLFDFQKDIDRWALKKGKAALFEDCGLGKTPQQLEWAEKVYEKTNKPVLIVAPLAVSKQTIREGKKFGIDVNGCRNQDDVKPGINITNYEMLNHFRPDEFIGVVLDESSILKSYSGKVKQQIIKTFQNTKFKLSCTATPAPNDHMEILNQAEFLGVMKSHEALAIWFINDSAHSGHYKLKGHAVKPFWEWVSTWAVCISKPSDIGYDDGNFILPKLNVIEEIINVNQIDPTFQDGFLRKIDMNATAYQREKRYTAEPRARESADIATSSKDQFLIWCDTNYEADELKRYIPEAVEIRGSDKPEHKEDAAMGFIDGDFRVLISKPSIFGFGLNFQQCHNTIFCGLSYSYEDYYQATRRLWRFGQKSDVNAYVVLGDTEKQILDVVRQKEALQEEMKRNMYGSIKQIQNANIRGTRFRMNYSRNEPMQIPGWLKEA